MAFAVAIFAAADQPAFFVPLGPQAVVVVVAFGVLRDVPFDFDGRIREAFANHFAGAVVVVGGRGVG